MKNLLILFIINCSLLITNCFSQWVQQTSGVTTSLLDVEFVNQNTGWASGDGGVILKTTNGGINWIQQISGSFNRLEGIYAVDANIVYCVGWFQTILKTTDGGNNWLAIRNGTTNTVPSFFSVYFLNQNTGWLLRNNYILRTINGGVTFDSTYTTFSYIYDVYFKDASTGVLCGDVALILRSTDAGVSWNQISVPLYQFQGVNFYRLSFIGNTGWTIGDGGSPGMGRLVYKTSNFGSNWDTIGRVPYPTNNLNYSVFFSSLNIGYSGGTNGYLFKTINGGFNWFQQVITGGGFRRDFHFVSDSVGWVVGGGGQIFKTTTGGQYVSVQPISNYISKDFMLFQNYPNPFNSSTKIKFNVSKSGNVIIEVYDIIGKKLETLVNDNLITGTYEIIWNAVNYSSGIYIYKFTVDNFSEVKKMVLNK